MDTKTQQQTMMATMWVDEAAICANFIGSDVHLSESFGAC